MNFGDEPPSNVRELVPGTADLPILRSLKPGPPEELALVDAAQPSDSADAAPKHEEFVVQWSDGSPIAETKRRRGRGTRRRSANAVTNPRWPSDRPDASEARLKLTTAAPGQASGQASAPAETPAPSPAEDRNRGARRGLRPIVAVACTAALLGAGALLGFTALHQPTSQHRDSARPDAHAKTLVAPKHTSATTTTSAIKPSADVRATTTHTVVKLKHPDRRVKLRTVAKTSAAAGATSVSSRPASSAPPVEASSSTEASASHTSAASTSSYANCPDGVSPDAGCMP